MFLLGLAMERVTAAPRTEFLKLDAVLVVAAILFRGVVSLTALAARQGNNRANCFLCHFSLQGG
jgi:hypothetical protein